LAGNPAFSGATILGDGRVALILDVLGIVTRSGVVDVSTTRASEQSVSGGAGMGQQTSLLVVASGTERLAIPLADVARLEKIGRDAIERSAGRDVVQYRDSLLPIVTLAELIGGMGDDVQDPVPVIVHDFRGHSIGIAVDMIVDIVETEVPATVSGARSSVVIDGRVTQIVDIKAVLEQQGSWLAFDGEEVSA
jgi:two-component system chemotaxis sensor kinase CheA